MVYVSIVGIELLGEDECIVRKVSVLEIGNLDGGGDDEKLDA